MKKTDKKIDSIFWFRRDLRTYDNKGLFHALSENESVLPIFIFDENILSRLSDPKDKRVSYIHDRVSEIKKYLKDKGSDIEVFYGKPAEVFEAIVKKYEIKSVYTNRDYDPYSRKRDEKISKFLDSKDIQFKSFKDQVIFEQDEIVKDDGTPYLIYTPYSKKWLSKFSEEDLKNYSFDDKADKFQKTENFKMPSHKEIGFEKTDYNLNVQDLSKDFVSNYNETRNIPSIEGGTSMLSTDLRFGAVSVRDVVRQIKTYQDTTFLKEIIWREFFHMILFYFPKIKTEEIKENYRGIKWEKDKNLLKVWKEGKTGFPLVDAGMRQLNETGYMHNRVRMLTASFLVKLLRIDWREGEKYFAEKLLDYDQAQNAGNWQWAAGTGTDAAPYFRIFNPYTQLEKFDPDHKYIKRWVPDFGTDDYPKEIIDYKEERKKALGMYKSHLEKFK